MKSFTYTMNNAFPLLGTATHLGYLASCYPDTTGTLKMGTRIANMTQPMKLASMGVRKGDRVTVSVEGPSEVELFDVLCSYFTDAM